MTGPVTGAQDDPRRRRIMLAGLLIVAALLGLRGIGDESSVMLRGDMARYVMNGVFVRDLLADGGVTSYDALTRYAELYYARYPALSLGHHPPVPYLSLVPFYWVFGVSIFAVRIAALVWFLGAVWGLYAVAGRLFSREAAMWATLLFVTNLVVLRAGQYLLSEMPMTALVLWSIHALLQFCDMRKSWRLAWFVVLVVLSTYAKQLAVLMFPVYGAILVVQMGWRTLLTKRAILVMAGGVLLLVPMAIMTVGLSPRTFAHAMWNSRTLFSGSRDIGVGGLVATILAAHLSIPALAVTFASVVLLIARRRKQVVIGLVWMASVVGGCVVFAGSTEPARYAFGALPAYFLLIGALVNEAKTWRTRVLATAGLSIVLWSQVWVTRAVYPSGAGGYEAAAEYVLAQNREPAVLYHSYIDTGYFVFFTRKHDAARAQIVLRSDKLLGWRPNDYARDGEVLHPRLKTTGVRWLVVESQPPSGGRRALYEQLAGPQFVERRRFPVVSTAASDLELIVYEYLDAQPADLDATMTIDLPFRQRDYVIRLRDLVGPQRQR